MAKANVSVAIESDQVYQEIKTSLLKCGVAAAQGALVLTDKGGVNATLQAIASINNNVARLVDLFVQYYEMPSEVQMLETMTTSLQVSARDLGKLEQAIRALAAEWGPQRRMCLRWPERAQGKLCTAWRQSVPLSR